jgi:Protein of unknown function (DUF1559)
MAQLSFTCPCGKALHAYDERAAERVHCPECGRVHVMPRSEAIQATAAPLLAQPTESVPPAPDVSRPPATTSGLALASFVLGIVSVFPGCLLGLILSAPAGGAAIVLGVIGLMTVRRSRGRKKGAGRAVMGVVTGVLGILVGILAVFATQEVNYKTSVVISTNNLKMIGLGMMSYSDSKRGGEFPPAAHCDAAGKPLLSWRVLILPHMMEFGAAGLFQKFKLDESWDGPNNSKLLSQMPSFYALPGDLKAKSGDTHYRVFVGNGAAFDKPSADGKGVWRREFTDGKSSTILVVEARDGVPWTKPDELDFDPKAPLPPLGGRFRDGFQALMADGAYHWVGRNVSEPTLRAAITRAGGETLGKDW